MGFHYRTMHGAGNRILVIDTRDHDGAEPPGRDAIARLADPAEGPGFDQLMWLTPPVTGESVAAYRVFNRDGTEVEQCGNGVRCVASLLEDEAVSSRLSFDSPAGRIEAKLLGEGRVAVNMGEPIFEPADIPFDAAARAPHYAIDVLGEHITASVLSMGNPHCVVDTDNIDLAPVATLGPALETHPRFPARVNVGFRQLIGPSHIALRVFERGVGETPACGTGACAAVVAGRVAGTLDESVCVDLPGGQLMVSWRGPGECVWLTGDTQEISEGTLDL